MSGVTDIVKEKMRFSSSQWKLHLQQIFKTGRCLGLSPESSSMSWARTVSSGWSLLPISKRWKFCKEGNFYEVLFQVLVMGNLSALFFGPYFRMFNFDNLVVKVKIKCPSSVWWLQYRYQRHHILCSWEHLLVLWRSRTYAPSILSHSKQPRFCFPSQFRPSTTLTIHRIAHNTFTFWCIHFSLFSQLYQPPLSLFLSIAIIFTSTLQTEDWWARSDLLRPQSLLSAFTGEETNINVPNHLWSSCKWFDN